MFGIPHRAGIGKLAKAFAYAAILVTLAPTDLTDYPGLAANADAALQGQRSRLANSKDEEDLTRTVAELKGEAKSLADLLAKIRAPSLTLDAAKSQHERAKSDAGALRQQAQNEWAYAENRLRQLDQSQYAICSQMSGVMNGKQCTFSCQSDQMHVCQQRVAAFESQVADLKRQAQDIGNKALGADKRATTAEEHRDLLAGQLAALVVEEANRSKELVTLAGNFGEKLTEFYGLLWGAKRMPLPINSQGPAWRQLLRQKNHLDTSKEMMFDCFATKCADVGALPDGSLVVPPEPTSKAVSPSSTTYRQTLAETERLVKQYNDQRAAAIATTDPLEKRAQIGDLSRTLTEVGVATATLRNRYKIDNLDNVPAPTSS